MSFVRWLFQAFFLPFHCFIPYFSPAIRDTHIHVPLGHEFVPLVLPLFGTCYFYSQLIHGTCETREQSNLINFAENLNLMGVVTWYNYVTGNAWLAQIACSSILVVIATVQHSSQNSGSLGHWFSSPQVFGSLGPQFLVHWVQDLYLTFLSGVAVQIHRKNHIIHSKSTTCIILYRCGPSAG